LENLLTFVTYIQNILKSGTADDFSWNYQCIKRFCVDRGPYLECL